MQILKLPGLIDIHVHLRDPGQTEKEDFYTGTCAALAGGFTTVIDMPNNKTPITTKERLEEKINIAKNKTVSDIGFYFGSLGDNLDEFSSIQDKVFGIKLYLNVTTGNFIIDEPKLEAIYKAWPSTKPILVHAEEDVIDMVISVMKKTKKKTHVCHISSEKELSAVIKAKNQNMPITCGVCPHHLFLTGKEVDKLGSHGIMKPPLKREQDKEFLWNNLDYIDVIESDHAPHTLEEKEAEHPPFGVPGLETTLPLLLTAMHDGKISKEKIVDMAFTKPAAIFNILTEENTFIEVDLDEEYSITGEDFFSKSKWTPFEGWKVKGKLKSVYLGGKKVFEDGTILIGAGGGTVVFPHM